MIRGIQRNMLLSFLCNLFFYLEVLEMYLQCLIFPFARLCLVYGISHQYSSSSLNILFPRKSAEGLQGLPPCIIDFLLLRM
jgi:hypothetical protein